MAHPEQGQSLAYLITTVNRTGNAPIQHSKKSLHNVGEYIIRTLAMNITGTEILELANLTNFLYSQSLLDVYEIHPEVPKILRDAQAIANDLTLRIDAKTQRLRGQTAFRNIKLLGEKILKVSDLL